MKWILVLLTVALLCGCQAKEDAEFGQNPRILTDDNGNRYVVKNYGGNTYSVEKIIENQK